MAAFQLILLSERERPTRETRPGGDFALIQFRSRIELEMAAERADAREISAEQLASWWAPSEALAYGRTCLDSNKAAANAIWQRLVAGLIGAVASTSSEARKRLSPVPNRKPEIIPGGYWKYFSANGSDFWGVGDVRFYFSGSGTSTVYHAFQVKLNPADVRDSLPPPKPPPKKWIVKRYPEPESKPEPEPEQKGPPVAEEHLKAWYEVYKRAFTGSADTLENAWASARGMFHNKSVTRKRISDLRGDLKPGRKPRDGQTAK